MASRVINAEQKKQMTSTLRELKQTIHLSLHCCDLWHVFGSGRQVSQVSALVSGSSGLGSSPRSGHRFVFLGKTIESCVAPSPKQGAPREGRGV